LVKPINSFLSVAREQRYVSRKEAKGARRGVRVNPYSFNLADSKGSTSIPNLESLVRDLDLLKKSLQDFLFILLLEFRG
jgi:hypothetical protein